MSGVSTRAWPTRGPLRHNMKVDIRTFCAHLGVREEAQQITHIIFYLMAPVNKNFFFLLRKVSLDLRLLEVYASVATRARL